LALFGCLPAVAQQAIIDLDDGTSATVTTRFHQPMAPGPTQTNSLQATAALSAAGLAFYTTNYASFGASNPFNIVGTDPSLGAATTTVPTVIVPLKFVFPNAPTLNLDGTNVVAATVNSPIFQVADYTAGGTDLGVTQYGDAIQRAEFWNLPGFSPGYHVLLGSPTVAATVTVTVPAGKGTLYRLSSGGLLGVVDTNYFSSILAALLPGYSANTLPVFLTDNVYLGTNGIIQNCCILGFHESQSPPISTAKTWMYAAYTEPGTFRGDVILDVQPLSHETAEWLNDPFVGALFIGGINLIPPAVLPGQGGSCIINFETGDPLEAPPVVFTKTTNGTTYHLQDEVFLPWYLHGTSFSVNGWFTFLNTFGTASTLCGPG
jgi:hypothetical protein